MTPRFIPRQEPFNPDEMLERVERLKAEGRFPAPDQFLKALREAILEEKAERET